MVIASLGVPWEPLETRLPEGSEAISRVIPGRCKVDCPSADEGGMLCSRNSMGKGPNMGESIRGVGNRERGWMAVREEVAEAREALDEMGMKESGLPSRAVFSADTTDTWGWRMLSWAGQEAILDIAACSAVSPAQTHRSQ